MALNREFRTVAIQALREAPVIFFAAAILFWRALTKGTSDLVRELHQRRGT